MGPCPAEPRCQHGASPGSFRRPGVKAPVAERPQALCDVASCLPFPSPASPAPGSFVTAASLLMPRPAVWGPQSPRARSLCPEPSPQTSAGRAPRPARARLGAPRLSGSSLCLAPASLLPPAVWSSATLFPTSGFDALCSQGGDASVRGRAVRCRCGGACAVRSWGRGADGM